MLGLTKPRKPVIGLVLAGEIESAGKDIKRFKTGDQVYGLTGFGLGAYAKYKCMKEIDSTNGCLAVKPVNLKYEEAAVAAYGGLLAFQFMEMGNVQPGQNVLIYGASGTTGTTAIQYARYLGAKITGVCSTSNLELVKSLGADLVIDYTRVDTTDRLAQYDFILDAVGKSKTSKFKEACKKALAPGGKYVSIDDGSLLLDSKRLAFIKELAEAGYLKQFIDKSYKLDEMAEAHRYVEKGHKRWRSNKSKIKKQQYHTGDIFVMYGLPFIDEKAGGDIYAMIDAIDTLVSQSKVKTKFIPGHGPVCSIKELRDYRTILDPKQCGNINSGK
jgi:NADPH:quinone reductase-like Zn-dependent oxidoreductase